MEDRESVEEKHIHTDRHRDREGARACVQGSGAARDSASSMLHTHARTHTLMNTHEGEPALSVIHCLERRIRVAFLHLVFRPQDKRLGEEHTRNR